MTQQCAVCEANYDEQQYGGVCDHCDHDVCQECLVEVTGEGVLCKGCVKVKPKVDGDSVHMDRTAFRHEGDSFKIAERDGGPYPYWFNPNGGWIPINCRMPKFDKFTKGLLLHFQKTLEIFSEARDNRTIKMRNMSDGSTSTVKVSDDPVEMARRIKVAFESTKNTKKVPFIDVDRCLGFTKCAEQHPTGSELFSWIHTCLHTCMAQPIETDRLLKLDPAQQHLVIVSGCNGCMECLRVCPKDAITITE